MAWYDEHIASVPGVQGGSPIIRGTRTPVRTVATLLYETYGGNRAEVRAALPHLSHLQVEAALAYYGDHRAEVDADIARHNEARERVRRAS